MMRIDAGQQVPGILRVGLLWVAATALSSTACRGQQTSVEQLEDMRDALLPRIEEVTGLRARGRIAIETRDRATLRAYVEQQMKEDMPRQEMQGVQAAYAHLGLLPDTLDLEALFLELYTEQVVGYYDPGEKTLYVMEGVGAAEVETVLTHELVHALQDQYIDLDSLIARERGNDPQTAAQAAIEGHATLAMVMLMMPRNASPAALPDLGAQLRPALEQENSRFPVFRGAPPLIRELLLFPYLGGAGFVQALWRSAGTTGRLPPFTELIPESTEQVLHPLGAFAPQRDPPTPVMLGATPAGWSDVYENGLGELEIGILLRLRGAADEAAAAGWDGDRYRLMRDRDGRHALVWYSAWDDSASADRFAAAFSTLLSADAARHGVVERADIAGRPVVRVISADRAVPAATLPMLEATLR